MQDAPLKPFRFADAARWVRAACTASTASRMASLVAGARSGGLMR